MMLKHVHSVVNKLPNGLQTHLSIHNNTKNNNHLMLLSVAIVQENVWLDKYKYDQAEKLYFENLAKVSL